MESLSPELTHALRALGLSEPRDLRRCRARVRRMTRDLPAFDSVWLDALVQIRRLTPYQAKVCISEGPAGLAVGPLVLTERIGGDGRWEMFQARPRDKSRELELTRIRTAESEQAAVLERLQRVVARLRDMPAPQIAAPLSVQFEPPWVVAVATRTPGRSLNELLVRRGRFPVAVVSEIARQLAAALDHLSRTGVLHGDLRGRNVRIDDAGRLHLIQTGLLAAVEPTVTIHSDIPADAYDGIAPELIDTRAERSTASDMYALGCLLWQLLAGRPPYPGGDPLMKLAAHQGRRIADVRQWRPETPGPLAQLIRQLTEPDPRSRPRSFAELSQLLRRPSAHASPVLRRFARAFQSAAPRMTSAETPHLHPLRGLTIACLLLTVGLGAGWMHGGIRSGLLRATQPLQAALRAPETTLRALAPAPSDDRAVETQTAELAATPTPQATDLPLPEPRHGVIRLTAAGTYRAGSVAAVGALRIEGAGEAPAVIVVDADPLRLSGVTVVIQNVAIARTDRPVNPTAPLVDVTAQDFGLIDCFVDGGRYPAPQTVEGKPALIQWRPVHESSATGGRIGWSNVVVTGAGDAVQCEQAPASLQFQNVLHIEGSSLVHLPSKAAPRPLALTLKHVTLRGAQGLLSFAADASRRPPVFPIVVERCVFDLVPSGGLVELRELAPPRAVRDALAAVRISGIESFLQAGSALAVQRLPGVGVSVLDAEALPIEGVQFSTIRFSGPLEQGWRAAAVDREWVRLSGAPATGCDLAAFARFSAAPYNLHTQSASTLNQPENESASVTR